jgi:glycosyltransferase involved in cell wall biosynthesis
MKTPEIVSFHPGKQHNLEQALQIYKGFKNFKHITSLYFSDTTVKRWQKISPKISSGLKKRSAALPGQVVDINPVPEVKLLFKRALGHKADTGDYLERNRIFQEWMLRQYAPPKICIGYDTSSWLVFRKWKNKSFLILDLSIAVPQYKLTLAREYNLQPDFTNNLTHGDEPLYPVYAEELALADLILCGSEFVKDSCLSLGVNPEKLMVLPYGADLNKFNNPNPQPTGSGKIKVAFVGGVNYRKGADTVLKAWESIAKRFPQAELHFYGNVQMDLPSTPASVVFHGFVNQNDLIQDLKTAHISILPSFLEGSSLAIYQSMALGLAIITTPNTGSVVEDKKTGFIIPYGAVEEVITSLELLLGNETLRKELAAQAQAAIKKYTWENYGLKLNQKLGEILSKTAGLI